MPLQRRYVRVPKDVEHHRFPRVPREGANTAACHVFQRLRRVVRAVTAVTAVICDEIGGGGGADEGVGMLLYVAVLS